MKRLLKATLWAVAILAITAGAYRLVAQSVGYRFTANGIVFVGTGTVCFEPTYNAGPDVCVERPGIGHISFLSGNLAVNKDISGSGSSPVSVTFANAYTVAPLCFAADASATPAAVQVAATTTTLTLTGTSGHTLNYLCIGNPN